jgi:hypothetical protein
MPVETFGDHDDQVPSIISAPEERDLSQPTAEAQICDLEAQIVNQLKLRDSLIIQEMLQKSDVDMLSNRQLLSDASNEMDQPSSKHENQQSGLEKSVRDLHSEAYDLSGLEFRARSMARIASQRLLVQDAMLTAGGVDCEDPLLCRSRQLMQERDRRVKDLTIQLRALNEMRDRIDSMRHQRAALAIENRSLANDNTTIPRAFMATTCGMEGSEGAGASGREVTDQSRSDVTRKVQILEKMAAETRRNVKIRSIFTSLVPS